MLRVLHVITGLKTGGAEMMLYKLLSCQRYFSYKSHVISLLEGGRIFSMIMTLGIVVNTPKFTKRIPTAGSLIRLIKLCKQSNYDIIQGWMYHGNLISVFVHFFAHRKSIVVWNVRQSLYDFKHERLLTKVVIKANAFLSKICVDAIIYNSVTGARHHEQIGFSSSKTYVIPNGFDTDIFKPDPALKLILRKNFGISNDTIVIGMIARFHIYKDHSNFFDAARILIKSHPNVTFILAGNEVCNSNNLLQSIIHQNGLENYVKLLGDRDDISQLNLLFDIATSSSIAEGFANVVGEAMSCGVPCVVTDVGDSAWVVGNTGVVVQPRDPQSLANGWMSLISIGNCDRTRLGLRARERIVQNFSIKAVSAEYERLYQSLKNKK